MRLRLTVCIADRRATTGPGTSDKALMQNRLHGRPQASNSLHTTPIFRTLKHGNTEVLCKDNLVRPTMP